VDVTPKVSPAQNAYRQSYENEIRHFVECIKIRRKPFSSGEDAVITLKVLEALYASAAEGREVTLA
jgi:predicted dehydrogenase